MSGLGGSADYGCKAPDGVKCESVSGNYYNSLMNNLPSQRSGKAPPSGSESAPEPTMKQVGAARSGVEVQAAASAVHAGMPLRSEPRVLRLWVKAFEDPDRDLVGELFVYLRVDDGRWLIDHTARQIQDAWVPVRAPRNASNASARDESAVRPQAASAMPRATDAGAAADVLRRLRREAAPADAREED